MFIKFVSIYGGSNQLFGLTISSWLVDKLWIRQLMDCQLMD